MVIALFLVALAIINLIYLQSINNFKLVKITLDQAQTNFKLIKENTNEIRKIIINQSTNK